MQKKTPTSKKDVPSATSVLDASSQIETLQRKADIANSTVQREETPHPNNTGMPNNLKTGIESLSDFSMDNVCVHYNSSKPATVQALAYTQGTGIHVAPGQEKHLPHEAWHVAQQMAGRVSSTTNINGMPVNDNATLEHEADVMGEKATLQKKAPLKFKQHNNICKKNNESVTQCIFIDSHDEKILKHDEVIQKFETIDKNLLEWGLYHTKIYDVNTQFIDELKKDYSLRSAEIIDKRFSEQILGKPESGEDDGLWTPSLEDLERAHVSSGAVYYRQISEGILRNYGTSYVQDPKKAKEGVLAFINKIHSLISQYHDKPKNNANTITKKQIIKLAAQIGAGVQVQGLSDGNHRSHALLATVFLIKNGYIPKDEKTPLTELIYKAMPKYGQDKSADEIAIDLEKVIRVQYPHKRPVRDSRKSWEIIMDETRKAKWGDWHPSKLDTTK